MTAVEASLAVHQMCGLFFPQPARVSGGQPGVLRPYQRTRQPDHESMGDPRMIIRQARHEPTIHTTETPGRLTCPSRGR